MAAHQRFTLEILQGQNTLRFPGLICRNTYPDQRAWRINLFDPEKSHLLLPHLTITDHPGTPEEIAWHLKNQCALHEHLQGSMQIHLEPSQKTPIELNSLWVSQEALRKPEQLAPMVDFAQQGGIFNQTSLALFHPEENTLITLHQFPDGLTIILDGHHRITSLALAGRAFLHPEEYELSFWNYEDFLEISFSPPPTPLNWVTPLDPRTEVRIPDLLPYKQKVEEILNQHGEEKAKAFILQNRPLFCLPRRLKTPQDLAQIYQS